MAGNAPSLASSAMAARRVSGSGSSRAARSGFSASRPAATTPAKMGPHSSTGTGSASVPVDSEGPGSRATSATAASGPPATRRATRSLRSSEPRRLAASASTSEGMSSARPLARACPAVITSYSPRSTSTENRRGSGSTRAGSTTLQSSPAGGAGGAATAGGSGGGATCSGAGRGAGSGARSGGGAPALRSRIIRASDSPSAARSGKSSPTWPEETGASSLSAYRTQAARSPIQTGATTTVRGATRSSPESTAAVIGSDGGGPRYGARVSRGGPNSPGSCRFTTIRRQASRASGSCPRASWPDSVSRRIVKTAAKGNRSRAARSAARMASSGLAAVATASRACSGVQPGARVAAGSCCSRGTSAPGDAPACAGVGPLARWAIRSGTTAP